MLLSSSQTGKLTDVWLFTSCSSNCLLKTVAEKLADVLALVEEIFNVIGVDRAPLGLIGKLYRHSRVVDDDELFFMLQFQLLPDELLRLKPAPRVIATRVSGRLGCVVPKFSIAKLTGRLSFTTQAFG